MDMSWVEKFSFRYPEKVEWLTERALPLFQYPVERWISENPKVLLKTLALTAKKVGDADSVAVFSIRWALSFKKGETFSSEDVEMFSLLMSLDDFLSVSLLPESVKNEILKEKEEPFGNLFASFFGSPAEKCHLALANDLKWERLDSKNGRRKSRFAATSGPVLTKSAFLAWREGGLSLSPSDLETMFRAALSSSNGRFAEFVFPMLNVGELFNPGMDDVSNECSAMFCLRKGSNGLVDAFLDACSRDGVDWRARLSKGGMSEGLSHALSRADGRLLANRSYCGENVVVCRKNSDSI